MSLNRRKTYRFFIILYLILIVSSIIAFSLMPYPSTNMEGFFITPGNVQIEWIFAIIMAGITGVIAGLFSIYVISPIFIKFYIRILSKKYKIRIAKPERLEGKALSKKIWARSFILGFFVGNICYILAGQEIIIEFMRSVNPLVEFSIPDIETMWQLAWIITIPSTFIVIPIYVLGDAGIIVTKNIKGFQSDSVNLANKSLYKFVKGYAGIGFIYNLIIMIIFWVIPVIQRGIFELAIIIQIISPLIAAGSAFPGVLILEYLGPRIRNRFKEMVTKLDSDNELFH